MNVTLNTNRFNTTNPYKNRQNFNQQPSFKGGAGELTRVVTEGSHFYDPLVRMYDKFAEKISEHVVPRVMDNKFMGWIADKSKGSNLLFNHFSAVGSLITSGMYMYKTLDNKDMDKDRKQTLAINQGLTFAISTVGAYALDKYVENWWQKVTAKYVGYQTGEGKFAENFITANKDIRDANKLIKVKKDKAPLKDVVKYFKELHPEKFTKELDHKLSGMGLLKKMLVFGMVYRYLVPVLVVPIANKIGDHNLAKKKANEARVMQSEQAKQG